MTCGYVGVFIMLFTSIKIFSVLRDCMGIRFLGSRSVLESACLLKIGKNSVRSALA